MEQLSGLDSLFLYAENDNVHQHVSAFGIYDTATCAEGRLRFRDLLAHFERRLRTTKVFRRRLLTVPHDLDRPYWVDDPDVDIEFHVRHIALPQPGDWRQLMILLARLHSRALDLSKPLWEIYVIEGLENIPELPPGAFAMLFKVHNAVLDTAAALQIVRELHSPSAHTDRPVPANEVVFASAEPRPLNLYGAVLKHAGARTLRLSRLYARLLGSTGRIGLRALWRQARRARADKKAARPYRRAPHTRFNAPVSPHRVFGTMQLPLARIAELRQHVGHVTVNDVYLATLAGALRAYLQGKGELPQQPLRALLTMALDSSGTTSMRAGRLPASLHTERRDPLARLNAIHDEVRALRLSDGADLGKTLLPELLGELPNFAAQRLVRHLLLRQVNCLVANVRGPDQPLYIAGARALRFCPIGIIADDVGLAITGFSYDGMLNISFNACRSMMPDPGSFAECLDNSFDELCRAAERRAQAGRQRKPAAARQVLASADA